MSILVQYRYGYCYFTIMKEEGKRGNKLQQEKKRLAVTRFLVNKEGTHQQAADKFRLSKSAVDRIWLRFKRGNNIIEFIQKNLRIHNDTHKIDYLRNEKLEAIFERSAEKFKLKKADVIKIWEHRNNKSWILNSNKRGKAGLEPEQLLEVANIIKKSLPNNLKTKLSHKLWTRDAVHELIKIKYGIELSRWQIVRHLKSWGIEPQKLSAILAKNKMRMVEEWCEKDYSLMKDKAADKMVNAVIYFVEKTKIIKDKTLPLSYMVSAINNKGHFHFMITPNIITNEVFEKFLKLMHQNSKRRVFFILSNHISFETKNWLNEKKIKMLYTPFQNREQQLAEITTYDPTNESNV
jgi:transposase